MPGGRHERACAGLRGQRGDCAEAGSPRERPARGVLRPDRDRLAASQNPGCVLPGGGIAHLRASDPVRRRRHDLRRAAICDRDHGRKGSRRTDRRQRRTRSHRDAVDRAATGYPSAVPGRLLSVGGDQAGSVARGAAAVAEIFAWRCASSTTPAVESRQHSRKARMPVSPRSFLRYPRSGTGEDQLLVVGALADVVEDQFVRMFEALGHRPGAIPAAAPIRRRCRRLDRTPNFCWRSHFSPTPRARWKTAAQRDWPRRSRWASRERPHGCGRRPMRSASNGRCSRA